MRVFSGWKRAAVLCLASALIIASPAASQVKSLTRISNLEDGTPILGAACPVISRDGQYVVFEKGESLLDVPNPKTTLFLLHRPTGKITTIVSDPIEASAIPCSTDISDDGRYVVFASEASNYVPNDQNGQADVFRFDRTDNSIVLVSVAFDGQQTSFSNTDPAISSDGRFVVFESFANNLVPNDTNRRADIFLRDLVLNTTTRISVGSGGAEANGDSFDAQISGDATQIAYLSRASNLVKGDKNKRRDLFLYDIAKATTILASRDISGNFKRDFGPVTIAINKDGRYVSFQSEGDNFLKGDTNGKSDVFLFDRIKKKIEKVSIGSEGVQGNRDTWNALFRSISDDGCYVGFTSAATNLIELDLNGRQNDLYVRDRCQKQTLIASVTPLCFQGQFEPFGASMTGDGKTIVFDSNSPGLVVGDTDSETDSFAVELIYPTVVNSDTQLTAPGVTICGRAAGFTLPAFTPGSLVAPLKLQAELLLNAKAAKKSLKYELEILSLERNEIRKQTSKRNILSAKNLKPGNYSAKYRVAVETGGKTEFETAFSPDVKFSVQ